jgi:hypothetical protein
MTLKIKVLVLDRHNIVAGLNLLNINTVATLHMSHFIGVST